MSTIPLKRSPRPREPWLARFPALVQARAKLSARWGQMADRERRGVLLACGLIALALGWMLLVAPALKSIRAARTQLSTLDAQWTQMQAQAAQARALKSAAPVSSADGDAALKAATERLGREARLTVQGDRATLQFSNLPGAALGAWMGEVRTGARARPIEASLSRNGTAYTGSIVLALPPR